MNKLERMISYSIVRVLSNLCGIHIVVDTPVPIPNTEVKHYGADCSQ